MRYQIFMKIYCKALVISLFAIMPNLVQAAELPTGTRTITLASNAGIEFVIGTASFVADGAGRKIEIQIDDTKLQNEFLSMRPFKCLEDPDKHYCYLPYPYDWQKKITPDDLTDLEYGLLFVQKGAKEYGINLWNGVYYKLVLNADGSISGTLHEFDGDILAVPPKPDNLRPITASDLNEVTVSGQWLPRLIIK